MRSIALRDAVFGSFGVSSGDQLCGASLKSLSESDGVTRQGRGDGVDSVTDLSGDFSGKRGVRRRASRALEIVGEDVLDGGGEASW